MDKKALQEMYLAYLRDEGYKGEVDADGDIAFKYEGGSYFITADEEVENFFRIIFPNFWEIGTDDEKALALAALNAVNAEYRLGKIMLFERDDGSRGISAALDSAFNDPNDFKQFFSDMLGILQNMVASFKEKMENGPDGGNGENPGGVPRCRNCGAELAEGVKFCTACGTKI